MKLFTVFHSPEGPAPTAAAVAAPGPAAPAPATAGSPGAEGSQLEQQEHIEDSLDVATLSDADLESKITGKPPVAPAPAKEDDKSHPAAAPAEDKTKVPPEPAPPAAPEKLYAGKYKTVDELKRGLLEIAKPLNYDVKVLERIIAAAEKYNDWSIVEDTYTGLNEALSKNQKATPPAPPAPDQPAHEEPPAGPDQERAVAQERTRVIVNETFRQIASSQIAQEIAEQGLELPTTKEQFDKLKVDYPYLAIKWDQEFTKLFHDIRKNVGDYEEALGKVEDHNKTAIESAKKQISDFVKEYKLEAITEAEIQKVVDNAMKADFPYEDRSGVAYLRENGILEYFLAKEFPKLAKLIKTNGELEGRTQHEKDLEQMRKKTVQSISTVKTPGSKARETPPVNPDDDNAIAALSDEDIEKLLHKDGQ